MWTSTVIFFCIFSTIPHVLSEKIIIIGAGPSGIATASKLLTYNITDFRILEAENRIGGRIHSIHFGDAYVDLGAEYIHGEKENVVYELTKNFFEKMLAKNRKEVEIYYEENKKTGDNLWNTFFEVLREIDEHPHPGFSLGEDFSERFNLKVQKYKNDTEMMNYAKNFLKTSECLILSLEGAFNWFEPSSFTNFVDCEGDQNLVWQGLGYKTIFDILLKNFPNRTGYNIDNQISFNKTVSKIILENEKVILKCEDGSEYTAEHVVFTPSLGVLKHDHRNIFQPNLSKEKVDVIENMGFDGVMKVIFEFPNTWWGDKGDFVFVWDDEKMKKLAQDVPFGPIEDNGTHWLRWFYSVATVPKNPRILIGWIVGPMVPKIEKLTEEEIKTGCIYVIRKFLGKHYNITEPVKVIHSKWYENPHFRGTYSFETPQLEKLNIKSPQSVLSEPIKDDKGIPRILFAGEATSPTRFSTVDGAIGTGFREAERLNVMLKNNL